MEPSLAAFPPFEDVVCAVLLVSMFSLIVSGHIDENTVGTYLNLCRI